MYDRVLTELTSVGVYGHRKTVYLRLLTEACRVNVAWSVNALWLIIACTPGCYLPLCVCVCVCAYAITELQWAELTFARFTEAVVCSFVCSSAYFSQKCVGPSGHQTFFEPLYMVNTTSRLKKSLTLLHRATWMLYTINGIEIRWL